MFFNVKVGLLLVLLVASGCVTTPTNLVDSGIVIVNIENNSLTRIHKVKVFQEGSEVLIRGHATSHSNQPATTRKGTIHINIFDNKKQLLKSLEVPFPVRHHKDKADFSDFYVRVPMILPMGSVVEVQYHNHK